MTEVVPTSATSPFDALRHVEADGSERWYGRELMPVMEYSRWERFAEVIEKAKASLALVQGAEAAEHHFPTWGSDGGRWGTTKLADYRLTRFGAYLTAMAGDDTKDAVARARVYFAVQTRKAEIASPASAPTDLDISDPHAIMLLAQAAQKSAQMAIEQKARAELAETRVAELAPKAATLDAIEAGDGMPPKVFRKHYFPDIPEREFFTHLYRRGFLIDQRGGGRWDEVRKRYRDGPQHGHPGANGNPYLYLHSALDRFEIRRYHTRVRPGQPEVAFRDLLVRQGLTPKLLTDADLERTA